MISNRYLLTKSNILIKLRLLLLMYKFFISNYLFSYLFTITYDILSDKALGSTFFYKII